MNSDAFSRSRTRLILVGFALCGTIAVGTFLATKAAAVDPRLAQCAVSEYKAVRVSFDIDRASEYATHLPAAAQLPELLTDDRPAFVAVFDGPVRIATVGTTGVVGGANANRQPTYESATCIVVGNEANVYPDLDATGAHR